MKGDLTLGEPEIVELHRQLQSALVQTEGKLFELESMFLEEAAVNSRPAVIRQSSSQLGERKQQGYYQGWSCKEEGCAGR